MNKSAIAAQLNIDEGRRNRLYIDTVGKITGGVGHNFDAKGISDAVVDLMLSEDIDCAVADLDGTLPWWRTLSEERQGVMVNMVFNMGINGLCEFKNTLSAIQAGDYDKAADEMLNSKWALQTGKRAKRLASVMRG